MRTDILSGLVCGALFGLALMASPVLALVVLAVWLLIYTSVKAATKP